MLSFCKKIFLLAALTNAVGACPTLLMERNDIIEQGETLYEPSGNIALVQQYGGNLQLFTGTPGNLTCLIWESGVCEAPVDPDAYYLTRLQGDGNLVTSRLQGAASTVPWKSDVVSTTDRYFFILTCDGNVGIYKGGYVTGDTPIWSEQGNLCGLGPEPARTAPPIPGPCNRTVLMTEGQEVRTDTPPLEGEGAYIEQLDTGAVVIRRGSVANPLDTLWQSCASNNPFGPYVTQLQTDSQFITRSLADRDEIVWLRDKFAPNTTGPWELALECDATGSDYGSLVITDPSGYIQWSDDLAPICEPRCPSATLLLDMNESILSDNAKKVTDTNGVNWTLQQTRRGVLRLYRGQVGGQGADALCLVWQSDATSQSGDNPEAKTTMQNDGNLVTYQRNVGAAYQAIWKSDVVSAMSSFTFVIDNCTFPGQPHVAVYELDPSEVSDAALLWFQPIDLSGCTTRRGLRGGEEVDDINALFEEIYSE